MSGSDRSIQLFHFSPSFQATVDPEFPGDGDWRCPVVGFGPDGQVQELFESRWGAPIVVEVTRSDGGRWIGQFAAGGLRGVSGVYAVPNSLQLCVVANGLAYLVDVDVDPPGAQVVHDQVVQVEPVADPDLLLLVRFVDIVALGPYGVAWRSPRLAVADLHVLTTTDGEIVCSLDTLGQKSSITLDAATGVPLTGTRLDSLSPPDALA